MLFRTRKEMQSLINAVPPVLAWHIAQNVQKVLEGQNEKRRV